MSIPDKNEAHNFLEAIGGSVGGSVDDDGWKCVCGRSGCASNSIEAGFALYSHRRTEHKKPSND